MKIQLSQTFETYLTVLCCTVPAAAQFDLSWSTIDGGGEVFLAAPGGWQLSGTIGQPDAGVTLTGGGFELVGGFWTGASRTRQCNECPGDINANGDVDLSDLSILLGHFGVSSGAACEIGDIAPPGGNGVVDLQDLSTALAHFGSSCN